MQNLILYHPLLDSYYYPASPIIERIGLYNTLTRIIEVSKIISTFVTLSIFEGGN